MGIDSPHQTSGIKYCNRNAGDEEENEQVENNEPVAKKPKSDIKSLIHDAHVSGSTGQ